MRLLGVILIIAGILVFLGNFTEWFPTIPGVGVVMVLVGGLMLHFIRSRDVFSSDVSDWRHNE